MAERDTLGLLERLEEDGAFGCWTFEYPGYGRVSRDLIESVNELAFLERELGAVRARALLACSTSAPATGGWRTASVAAYPQLDDYCCVDAIPESTFAERVLPAPSRRGASRARGALDRVEAELRPGSFDLAVNVHSFPECTLRGRRVVGGAAAPPARCPTCWWCPTSPTSCSRWRPTAAGGTSAELIERAGYQLVAIASRWCEDDAVRELVRLDDHFHLFALAP